MAKKPPIYHLYGLKLDGGIVQSPPRMYAPGESLMCAWGKQAGCAFVIRNYPLKGGYRALDIRAASETQLFDKRRFWKGQRYFERVYPTPDAAAMHLFHTALQKA